VQKFTAFLEKQDEFKMLLKIYSLFLALILVSTLFLGGCATMKYGTTQVITVKSNPEGAKVRFQPGGEEITTPSKIVLSRRSSYIATIEKEGFKSDSVSIISSTSDSIWRNLWWIHPAGWIIGIVVDISTGAGRDLAPETVDVTLTPLTMANEKAEVKILEENNSGK
jgi:hypothetical protein